MPSKFRREVLRARFTALVLFVAIIWGAPSRVHGQPDSRVRDDRLLIIPKAGHAVGLNALHGQSRARVLKVFPQLGNIHVLEVPQGTDTRALAARYRQSGHVETADPDHWITLSADPNDPGYVSGEQWHLNNTGQSSGLPDADIDAPEAWETFNSASNIIVAIIDSGVRQTHQDLAANLWVN